MTFWFKEGQSYEAHAEPLGEIISYSIIDENAYNIANGCEGPQTLYYSYTDDNGRPVTQNASTPIILDWKEEPIGVGSLTLTTSQGTSISDLKKLKQGMTLSTDFKVAAFEDPIAWLEKGDDGSWVKT